MKDTATFQNIILNHFNAPEDKALEQKVKELREQSPEHEKFFRDVQTIWKTAPLTQKLSTVNPKLSVNHFKDRLQAQLRYQPRRFSWYQFAAAAVLLIIAGFWFYPRQPAQAEDLVKETKQQIDSVFLSDGTKIILSKNSKISYPKVLAGNLRQVSLLNGQAFFKVRRDTLRPFSILIGKSKVSVLGTSFNIKYSKSAISLAVKTGKVMFSPNAVSSSAVLVAGQALKYDLLQQRIEWINAANANSWATKELHFVDMPLKEVCEQLSAYYNVTINVEDQQHIAKKFNAKFKDSSLQDIFAVLKQTYKIRIDTNASMITIKNL